MDVIAQIGLHHTNGVKARVIQGVTGSYWNHMTIRLTTGLCVGAQPRGVAIRRVTDFPDTVWSRFAYTPHQRARILQYAWAKLGWPYNWADIFLIAANLKLGWHPDWLVHEISNRRNFQCAQFCDAALMAAGVHVFNDGRPSGAVQPASFVPLFKDAGWLPAASPS